jgi:hypothetical protein
MNHELIDTILLSLALLLPCLGPATLIVVDIELCAARRRKGKISAKGS